MEKLNRRGFHADDHAQGREENSGDKYFPPRFCPCSEANFADRRDAGDSEIARPRSRLHTVTAHHSARELAQRQFFGLGLVERLGQICLFEF